MSRMTSDAVMTRLEAELGAMVQTPRRRPGPGTAAGELVPVVRPEDEVALVELLAMARAEGLALLPLGAGTKIDATPAPTRLDLLVDTSAFSGVLAFEPGDGTLTARAGTPMDELVALAASGGRSIVPRVAPGATLGGMIATAETGTDRLQRGPARDHVLGLDVMLSSGRTSQSGGRLVKNVAGFDLHRLHLGAWGGLGLILEATLRLFPTWRHERCLTREVQSLHEAVDLAHALRAARIDARRIHATSTWTGARTSAHLHVDLAGREETVTADAATTEAILGETTQTPPTPSEPRPTQVLHALPTKAKDLATLAEGLLADHPEATLHLDPLLARAALHGTGQPPASSGLPTGIHRSLPRPPLDPTPLTADIHRALDPTATWARH